jgi:hypothetical protein
MLTLNLMARTAAACALAGAAALIAAPAVQAVDTSPAQQLAYWSAQAGRPGQAEAGRLFFQALHGKPWSCASCHGMPPTAAGRHESTGKTIAPLAPAFNPRGLTDSAKVDKWFRRNCNDVAGRECSAQEKADVLAWLVGLKP